MQKGDAVPGEAGYDMSGLSIGLNGAGTRLAIGAQGNDVGNIASQNSYNGAEGGNYGHARVFEYTPRETWQQVGSDIDGESAGDMSGFSVSLSADGYRIVVGAHKNDDGGSTSAKSGGSNFNSGHVRVYSFPYPSDYGIGFDCLTEQDCSGHGMKDLQCKAECSGRRLFGAPSSSCSASASRFCQRVDSSSRRQLGWKGSASGHSSHMSGHRRPKTSKTSHRSKTTGSMARSDSHKTAKVRPSKPDIAEV